MKIVMTELLKIENVYKNIPIKKGFFASSHEKSIVSNVSFNINEGELISILGQSGSGKTTLAKIIAQLEVKSSGKIIFKGKDISEIPRRKIQMIFQDPYSTLNPMMKIRNILEEPLIINKVTNNIESAIERIGLDLSILSRYPHQLSGGQKQRVAIARALILEPELLILDESLSSIDNDNKKLVINIIRKLKSEKVSIILITHDLLLAKEISDRVGIILEGKLIEFNTTDSIYSNPQHPYTKDLLSIK